MVLSRIIFNFDMRERNIEYLFINSYMLDSKPDCVWSEKDMNLLTINDGFAYGGYKFGM